MNVQAIPLFARKFLVDFIETGLTALFGLSLAFPTSGGDLKVIGASIGLGLIGAAISAGRRAIPGAVAWVKGVLQVTSE